MPKMICVDCESELRVEHNGVYVIEMASFGPYKIWCADQWICRKCGKQTIAGFGNGPIAEHFESDFSEILEKVKNGKTPVIYSKET